MNIINYIGETFGALFGSKDAYTQTNFQRINQFYSLQKGEYKIDTSTSGLHDLVTTTSHLSAVIYRKADMLANGRWREYKLVNGKKELVEKSEAVNILENPNPVQDGNEFIRQLSVTKDTYGTSIINLNRTNLPIPKSMYVLPMQYVTINKTGKLYKQIDIKEIIESIFIEYSTREYFELDNLAIFKYPNPNDPVIGLSPIEQLKMPIANIRGALGFRNRIITNDAMLGVLSSDFMDGMGVGLDTKEQERLQEGLREAYGMQSRKANITMSQNPVKWTPMSYPTKDLLLFEEVDQDFKIIIDHYGLNDNLFSREKASTYSNLVEGIKMAYQGCIIPFGEDIALTMTKAFKMDAKTNWLELDFSHLEVLKDDEKVKSENLKRTVESISILNQNGYTDIANRMADKLIEE